MNRREGEHLPAPPTAESFPPPCAVLCSRSRPREAAPRTREGAGKAGGNACPQEPKRSENSAEGSRVVVLARPLAVDDTRAGRFANARQTWPAFFRSGVKTWLVLLTTSTRACAAARAGRDGGPYWTRSVFVAEAHRNAGLTPRDSVRGRRSRLACDLAAERASAACSRSSIATR